MDVRRALESLIARAEPLAFIDATLPDHVFITELDGEAVIFDATMGDYIALDMFGSRILELLQQCDGHLVNVVETMVAELEVPREQLSADLRKFITILEQNGLLRLYQTHP